MTERFSTSVSTGSREAAPWKHARNRARNQSREAAQEYSPRRKPWVESDATGSPVGAEEVLPHRPTKRPRRESDISRVAQRFGASITAPPSAVLTAEANFPTAKILCALLIALLLPATSIAVTKPHIISFGKWTAVQWTPGTNGDDKPLSIKIRPLIVDGRIKEYVTGAPHEVTERLFVVRRVFRVNDSLPDDSTPQWQWQRGGWLLVDRLTGRISAVNLPEFDIVYSAATWYRDYGLLRNLR